MKNYFLLFCILFSNAFAEIDRKDVDRKDIIIMYHMAVSSLFYDFITSDTSAAEIKVATKDVLLSVLPLYFDLYLIHDKYNDSSCRVSREYMRRTTSFLKKLSLDEIDDAFSNYLDKNEAITDYNWAVENYSIEKFYVDYETFKELRNK